MSTPFQPVTMKKYTFRKEERLCHQKLIDELFHRGSSFVYYPFRVVMRQPTVQEVESPTLIQVLISVPKRRHSKAVTRNLLKRRIREAYRVKKAKEFYPFFFDHKLPITFSIQYIAQDVLDYTVISDKMSGLLQKLIKEYAKVYLGKLD